MRSFEIPKQTVSAGASRPQHALPTEEDRVAPIETRLGCWVGRQRVSKVLFFPAVAWCGGGGLREPWGTTGAGGGKAMGRGGQGGEASSGGRTGQHQRKDGHARACRAIGIHSGVDGSLGLGPLTPYLEL